MRSKTAHGLLCLLLVSVSLLEIACSSSGRRSRHERPLSISGRQWLKVRPPKTSLDRKDLTAIALTYKILEKNEKPWLIGILEPNKNCRPSASSEELVLGNAQTPAGSEDAPCKTGVLLVPLD